ncbi:MAG: hypothetical protein ABI548_26825 [Polyangiaceae bacterium]
MFTVSLTLSPLIVAGVSFYSPRHGSWNDLFEFLIMCWLAEMMAALAGAWLIRLLKDARDQERARTSQAELLVARLAFWGSLLCSFVLPCAIAWVWMMGFAMLS